MSGSEILLVALAILVPLAIAIAVTLWTLQPAVLRNERAKRARKRFAQAPPRKRPWASGVVRAAGRPAGSRTRMIVFGSG